MKIAVLQSSYEGSCSPTRDLDPACDPARYLPGHEYLNVGVTKALAVRQITELERQDIDVAINLCDGSRDEDRAGIEVVQTLEQLEIPFTGAGSDFYDPSRVAMKMAWHAADVAFPAYCMARRPSDIERALDTLRFPMIVKHPHGYSSVGMTRDSRVADAAALRRETELAIARFGSALIEEFIEGREFTVLVTEPREGEDQPLVLQPVEFVFPPTETFKHFQMKWVDFNQMRTEPVSDPGLDRLLRDISGKAFSSLNGSGYGRTDIRLGASGEPFVLEINPNCGIFYPEGDFGSADVILANDPIGHRGFLNHLLHCAVRRRDRRRVNWEVGYTRSSGFGLIAKQAIAAGDLVVRFEEFPQTLVSRRHVERTWHGAKRDWFHSYCWPLTDHTHVMWSDNPELWRPINHSCDPNTWLDGLDVVARRAIAPGESLTIEYATFVGPDLKEFECRCGAADCRGTIRSTDYLLPGIRQRYQGHVSGFIQEAWRRSDVDR